LPFDAIFVPADLRDAVSDRAWLQALLDAEGAFARAEAAVGLIPVEAAEAIVAACDAGRFDPGRLAGDGVLSGNPAEPLVRALRAAVGDEAAQHVHHGATSQDIVDTAAMLVARRAVDLVRAEVDGVAAACAGLARRHRLTPIVGRTLLQQAVPTTFGLKAAGWLDGVLSARRRLAEVRFPAQLGGAAGTLGALGEHGLDVLRAYSGELELEEPVVPWHTLRAPVAELGFALALTAGAVAKIALDVVLLAQTEVGEVREPEGGVSSAMAHKRNPIRSIEALACARHVQAAAGLLTGSLAQEHERAAGAWHAEWKALSDSLAYTGGAAARVREALEGLEIVKERMRWNLQASAAADEAADPSAGALVDRVLDRYDQEGGA
jgi:3-carboxy-cis,cis-muconate cycloisomerase